MVQLIITMDDQGQLGVNGPIQNQVLCFGLLELAKIAVVDHNKKASENRVQLAPAGMVVPPVVPVPGQ